MSMMNTKCKTEVIIMANNNLWIYWAKKLHIVDENNNDWYGYCDDVTNECDSMGDSLIIETAKGFFEFARCNIRYIETI